MRFEGHVNFVLFKDSFIAHVDVKGFSALELANLCHLRMLKSSIISLLLC